MALQTLHLALEGAASGTVRALTADVGSESVLPLGDYLSIGPLQDQDSPKGREDRLFWMRGLMQKILSSDPVEDLAPRIGLPVLVREAAPHGPIVIWAGPNADEQLMLRCICSRWTDANLWLADVSVVGERAVGACDIDQLSQAREHAFRLPKEDFERLSLEWSALCKTKELLRIYEAGQVISCPEDFFDQRLLAASDSQFVSAARLVGEVMAQSPYQVCDTWLEFRLRVLINQGRVEAEEIQNPLNALMVRHS